MATRALESMLRRGRPLLLLVRFLNVAPDLTDDERTQDEGLKQEQGENPNLVLVVRVELEASLIRHCGNAACQIDAALCLNCRAGKLGIGLNLAHV